VVRKERLGLRVAFTTTNTEQVQYNKTPAWLIQWPSVSSAVRPEWPPAEDVETTKPTHVGAYAQCRRNGTRCVQQNAGPAVRPTSRQAAASPTQCWLAQPRRARFAYAQQQASMSAPTHPLRAGGNGVFSKLTPVSIGRPGRSSSFGRPPAAAAARSTAAARASWAAASCTENAAVHSQNGGTTCAWANIRRC
jgi:hypothetical protein